MVGCFFPDHDRRSVEIAVCYTRHDGGIGQAEPIDANHTAFAIYDACAVNRITHLARAAGMVGAFGVVTNERVDVAVGGNPIARLDFNPAEGREGRLSKNLAGQADAGTEFVPVVRMRHIVEAYDRRLQGIGRTDPDMTPRLRTHGTNMHLETVTWSS